MKVNRFTKRLGNRRTFKNIFPRCMIYAALLTALFAFFFAEFGRLYIISNVKNSVAERRSQILQRMIYADNSEENIYDNIEASLTLNSNYEIYFPFLNRTIMSGKTENCHFITFLKDKYNNVIADSSIKLIMLIKFDPKNDSRNGWYVCNTDALDNKELLDLQEQPNGNINERIEFFVRSAYLKYDEHVFVPHEIEVNRYKVKKDDEYELLQENELISTDKIVIDQNSTDFELVQLHSLGDKISDENRYPIGAMAGFYGEDKEICEKLIDDHEHNAYLIGDDNQESDNAYQTMETYCNGQKVELCSVYSVDTVNPITKKIFIKVVASFFGLSTLIALLYSWRKSVVNKASYAMEDYQRTLTNNLAHDLKTPLAAIGGYAENLIEQRKDSADEKEMRYLGSIMENVAYTDSMIKKTLKLAEIEKMQKPVISKVSLRSLTENAFEKYRLQLEERKITLSIEGNYGINAEEATLTDAIENLVSNAVKYTPKGGSISVTMKNSEYRITNDVTRKVDIKGLKNPFVKGDASRHDKNSSGLGLSIADTALRRNGYKLKLSCDDSCFSAWIKL